MYVASMWLMDPSLSSLIHNITIVHVCARSHLSLLAQLHNIMHSGRCLKKR